MKTIQQYIFEEFKSTTLNNLKVVFDADPKELVLQVPERYSESDVQIYITDRFGNQLPGDEKIGKKKFGKNFETIADAYFEYDAYLEIEKEDEQDMEIDIEWDSNFDTSLKNPSLKLVKIISLKYNMLFDTFTIEKSTYEKSNKIVDKIFKAAESNTYNRYPLVIFYDNKATEFTEE